MRPRSKKSCASRLRKWIDRGVYQHATNSYEAQNPAGQLVSGVLQSSTQREAVRQLNELRLLPLNLVEQSQAQRHRVRISATRLAALYQMLSDLLESGMPLLKSLELVAGQHSDPALGGVLKEITRRVCRRGNFVQGSQRVCEYL